jgi:hypothetical protein
MAFQIWREIRYFWHDANERRVIGLKYSHRPKDFLEDKKKWSSISQNYGESCQRSLGLILLFHQQLMQSSCPMIRWIRVFHVNIHSGDPIDGLSMPWWIQPDLSENICDTSSRRPSRRHKSARYLCSVLHTAERGELLSHIGGKV